MAGCPRRRARQARQNRAGRSGGVARLALRNPIQQGDDPLQPYQFAHKQEQYRDIQGERLAEWLVEAVAARESADRACRPLQERLSKAQAEYDRAEKALARAETDYREAYARYGWLADDVHTLADERNRQLEYHRERQAALGVGRGRSHR